MPLTQPLIQTGDLTYLGSFTLPTRDGSASSPPIGDLVFGGIAGISADGTAVYYNGHSQSTQMCKTTRPAIGGVASIIHPMRYIPQHPDLDSGDSYGVMGSALEDGSRLIVNAHTYYDTNPVAEHELFTFDLTILTRQGPYDFSVQSGMTGGWLGRIPLEWQALLGGDAFCGNAGVSIITRSSAGPCLYVFTMADVGVTTCTVTPLVGYQAPNNTYPDFNTADQYGGAAIPPGFRSALILRRHGPNENYCYGTGTGNPALVGTPDGSGDPYCWDPTDSSKGPHAYPYQHRVEAYDLLDLIDVKNGVKSPWEIFPYASIPLPQMELVQGAVGSAKMTSSFYDTTTRRWYISAATGSSAALGNPRVFVYQTPEGALASTGRSLAVGASGDGFGWVSL